MFDITSNYFIMRAYGGWSPCVQGNDEHGLRPFAGSVLPNCVGYIVGAFNAFGNWGACPFLGSVNANELMQYVSSQNLTSGFDPRVGACMVWDDGIEGHAAFVEQVIDNDTIITSESGWNYTAEPIIRTYTRHRASNWNWGGTFLGFIYNPAARLEEYYLLWLEDD